MGIKVVQGSVTVNSGGYENISDSSLFDQQPLTFTVPNNAPSTYAWRIFGPDGSFISSSTSATFVTSLVGAGTYTIRETVSNATLTLTLKSNSANRGPHFARGVVYNNQADLTSFTVASDDGVTYVAGEVVLLAGQSTAAQNGLYMVGKVTTGAAALTRVPDFATGQGIVPGTTVEVSEGTWYANSTWKAMCAKGKIVGTDDPTFYPKNYRQTVTLASGTYKIGYGSTATPDEPLFLYSTTRSTISLGMNTSGTAGGAPTSTTEYACPVATRVAGVGPATAVLVINAQVAAGTISNADTSTIDVTVHNW